MSEYYKFEIEIEIAELRDLMSIASARLEALEVFARGAAMHHAAEMARERSAAKHDHVAAPITRIIMSVADEYSVPAYQITGPSRAEVYAIPRQEVMRRAMDAGYSSTRIGRALGGRDHTTVLHGARRARDREDEMREVLE